jgi:hypothetical protein
MNLDFRKPKAALSESGESLVSPRGMIGIVAAVRRIRAVRHSMLLRQCFEKLRGDCRPATVEAASLTRSGVAADLYVKIQRLGRSARLVNYARMRA